VEVEILRIGTFLVSRIVLLNAVAVNGVVQKEREVGVEVKKRATQKTVDLQAVA